MKNLMLAASAALFSFAAAAQTPAPPVAGQTPADGRAYGQAVSTAAQMKNDDKARRPFKLTKAQKEDLKDRKEAGRDLARDQKEALKDRKEAGKDLTRDQKEAAKDRKEFQKDVLHDQKESAKDLRKENHMADVRADKHERPEHGLGARGEHGHDMGHGGMGHGGGHKNK